jgi:hypothetical protein
VRPSTKASLRYAKMTGQTNITAGEDRVAKHGETRAALLRQLMSAGGGDLTLNDLKNVNSWGDDKAQFRSAIDQFIAEKRVDAKTVYSMLSQSDRQLHRVDSALFTGAQGPLTLADLFGRADALEQKKLGKQAPAPSPLPGVYT